MKSHEQRLISLLGHVIIDVSLQCKQPNVSMDKDLEVIRGRVRHEGLSFLTITLPNFGKEFEKALDLGSVNSSTFQGWKRWKGLPAFLRGFLSLVFDADTGGLLNEPDITAIEGIRQIAYTYKKLSLQCTPERERAALRGYEEVECYLQGAMFTGDADLFNQVSRLLWGNMFNEQYAHEDFTPRHGPGQTAEGISGNRKYSHYAWTERLEPFFPADLFLMSCYSQLDDENEGINAVEYVQEDSELPVKVTCVPKTLKGPRIIAMEPVCMQYAQQALASYIIKKLETSEITGGHINFTDQTINQRLAISASSDGYYATLDLSEASDRVPLSLAASMFQCNPNLRDAILACRSKSARMPDGKIIPLSKFASMGSALCFPIEAMYFYTVILTSRLKEQNLPVTLHNIKKIACDVYVYGDDIIVPVAWVDVVTETLASFYCKVNASKSYWNGKFRESCGMDAYDGVCITPTYVRHVRPSDKDSVQEILSWVASANLFYKRGYWHTSQHIKKCVERILGELPIVHETSPGLGWVSFQNGYTYHRWNRRLHRFEVSTYVASTVYRRDPLEGWSALLKYFLRSSRACRNNEQSIDAEHLSRSPRSGTSSIKRRWTTPY